MFAIRSLRKIAVAAGFSVVLATASSAGATTIVSVTPGGTPTALAIGPGVSTPGAAAGFTLGTNYTDVSISIDFLCFFSCAGEIFLFQGALGPGLIPSNLAAAGTFDAASSTIGFNNLAALGPGNYFFALEVTQGNIIWNGSTAPAVTTHGLSFNGADLIVENLNLTSVLLSTFLPSNGFFNFNLTGTAAASTPPNAAVPLPGAAVLFIAGFGLLTRFRHQRH